MKKRSLIMVLGIVGLAVAAFSFHPGFGPRPAGACNWGSPGGRDYVPERLGPLAKAPSLSQEQAYDVVANYLRRSGPDRKVGELRDGGAFYEADVLGNNGQVVDRLAVDKRTGRLMPLY